MDAVRAFAEAPRRAGAHDVQGQGPGLGPSSARRRRTRPQRHAGRELAHERVRPAASCSARRSRTTPAIAPYKPIVQVDFDPMALGRFHPVTVPLHGHVGVTARLLVDRLMLGRGDPERVDQRADVAERWEIWRAEKAPAPADDRGLGVNSASVFDAMLAARARGRGHRGRRRQPRVLVRPLLRVHAPVDPDVGLPRLDRLRVPGRDGRVGRGARPARSSRSPATAASASTSPSSPPR